MGIIYCIMGNLSWSSMAIPFLKLTPHPPESISCHFLLGEGSVLMSTSSIHGGVLTGPTLQQVFCRHPWLLWMRSWAHWSCHVWKTVFHNAPHPLALSFCLLLEHWRHDLEVLLRAESIQQSLRWCYLSIGGLTSRYCLGLRAFSSHLFSELCKVTCS